MSTEISNRGPRRPWAGVGWCVLGALGLLTMLLCAFTGVFAVAAIGLVVLIVAGIRAWGSFTGTRRVGKTATPTT